MRFHYRILIATSLFPLFVFAQALAPKTPAPVKVGTEWFIYELSERGTEFLARKATEEEAATLEKMANPSPVLELPRLDRGDGRLTLPILNTKPVGQLIYMSPNDKLLVDGRNKFYEKIKELEDARRIYLADGRPLPDGFFTMHTAHNGWRINFLRQVANLYDPRLPMSRPSVITPSPAYNLLQTMQGGPAAAPTAPLADTGGLRGSPGGGGSVTSGGSFVGSINDWIAQNQTLNKFGKPNITIYGEISPIKTYSSNVMLPFWLDGHAAFVFNFNSLNNARPTTNPGERLGLIEVGMPGTDLAMAFETQKKPPLDTPYTYILFYRLIRIGDSLVEQRMTYEEFRAYAEKMGYWQKGWSLFGDKWELNTNDAWKDGKK